VFDTIRDCFLIADGADVTSLAGFADKHLQECGQAFHRDS